LEKQPDLIEEINQRVFWFVNNRKDTRLRDHHLIKRLKGKRAFSISEDVRIVYEETGKHEVTFLAIGGHARVYKR
jgi:mRNA-degrading endonuclease YafQ of YafQ-DinJ toxin-antitoxin module